MEIRYTAKRQGAATPLTWGRKQQGAATPLPCRGGVRGGVTILSTLLVLLLLTGCSGEEQSVTTDSPVPLSFVVSEAPWQQEHVNVTRSDASMLEDLKESAAGFGIFCANTWFKAGNIQMTWSNTTHAWSNNTYLWPKDVTSSNFGGAFNVYAYAPYSSTYNSTSMPSGGSAVLLTFSCPLSNTTDLLWAKGVRQAAPNNYTVNMQFQHALSKLSFGTLTNNSGKDITLAGIALAGKGEGLYITGKLSLADGTWNDLSGSASEANVLTSGISIPGDAATKTADIKNGSDPIERLLIPGQTATVTLAFTYNGKALTAVFDVLLTRAVHTTVNIAINKNFEVEIE